MSSRWDLKWKIGYTDDRESETLGLVAAGVTPSLCDRNNQSLLGSLTAVGDGADFPDWSIP